VIAFFSFGSIMMADAIGQGGRAAVAARDSTVFAARIGWLVVKETVGPGASRLMSLIALGAVIVEFRG